MSSFAPAVVGLIVGLLAGFMTRQARLCTFGALEDALEGNDWRRLKVFGLALGLALLGTQALVLSGWLVPTDTTYLPQRMALPGILVGGVLFGLGMAMVGTCGFGSLIRFGSGDLRGFVVILTLAAFAYATLRGIFSPLRINLVERVSFSLPGGHPAGAIELLEGLSGTPLRLGVAALGGLALIGIALKDRRLRKAPRLMAAGVTLGICTVLGWVATGLMQDAFATLRVQSLTFVAPVARGVFGLVMGGSDWVDFGTMSVAGVVMGAFLSAKLSDEFHWEAFDDPREMRRHLAGAMLMGTGGILAGGCTIGQGLTAASLMALSAPVALIGMVVGARLGIAILVEGSPVDFIRSVLARRSA
jgi:uncharacterized protein